MFISTCRDVIRELVGAMVNNFGKFGMKTALQQYDASVLMMVQDLLEGLVRVCVCVCVCVCECVSEFVCLCISMCITCACVMLRVFANLNFCKDLTII